MREAPHRGGGIQLLVRRPIEVVVLNCWVTETKDTPCRSNSSTSLAKSANERVRRSTHSIVLTVGQWKSMATFWPSTKPITFRPSRNAATRWAHGAAEPAAKPADRHRGLLRPRRNRPRGRGATEQRDELAPPHVEHGVSPLAGYRTAACKLPTFEGDRSSLAQPKVAPEAMSSPWGTHVNRPADAHGESARVRPPLSCYLGNRSLAVRRRWTPIVGTNTRVAMALVMRPKFSAWKTIAAGEKHG